MFAIETERLILRELTMGDLDALYEGYRDPEVMEYIGTGGPVAYADMPAAMERMLNLYRQYGHGLWAIVRKRDDALLGRCGLITWPDVEDVLEVEVGYSLARAHWGQGYASEAAMASRDWGFANLEVPHLVSFIRPANARSIRVALKNGMHYKRDFEFLGNLASRYEIAREAWERR